jgi:hypothetical protein
VNWIAAEAAPTGVLLQRGSSSGAPRGAFGHNLCLHCATDSDNFCQLVTLSVVFQSNYASVLHAWRTPGFVIDPSQSNSYESFGELGTVLALYTVLAITPFTITFIFTETDE